MNHFIERTSIGRIAAWHVISRAQFGPDTLWSLMKSVGLVGDSADGYPSWIDWDRVPDAERLLDRSIPLSTGMRATVRVVAAFASLDDALPALDALNRESVAEALLDLEFDLRRLPSLLGHG